MYIQIKYHPHLFVLIIDLGQECCKHKSYDLPLQPYPWSLNLESAKSGQDQGGEVPCVLLLEDHPLEQAGQHCVCLFSPEAEHHAHLGGNLLWLASKLTCSQTLTRFRKQAIGK